MPYKITLTLSLALTSLLHTGCGDSTTSTDDTSSDGEQNLTTSSSFSLPDTGQQSCFDAAGAEVECLLTGQDAMYTTNATSYTDNGDGTVTDNVTGMMWMQTFDTNGDGSLDADDRMHDTEALSYCEALSLGGFDDWQLPDIKMLYSLIDFSGKDISGFDGDDTSELTPFIDTDYFAFAYGDTDAGERLIDVQFASTSHYVADNSMLFGVNLADGRIKGYGLTDPSGKEKDFTVQCVRDVGTYGVNSFVDNGDKTISDKATGLMWHQDDSGEAMEWEAALSYCEDDSTGGFDDWKLPDAKELQSIVDYANAPDSSDSAAIDTDYFNTTSFINENGQTDYGYYWSSTTHDNLTGIAAAAVYISFGRALGYSTRDGWQDVHGAGAQRSDPKTISALASNIQYGSVEAYNGTAYYHGPQGDLLRGANFARCVRVEE